MFISMVGSKKECSKKTSEMIWKMPEKIFIKKIPKGDKKKYNDVKFVDQHE